MASALADANTTGESRTDPRTSERVRPPLLVFADDWGRHPSSCQHLVRRLREEYRVLWANSIGTRQPRLNGFTLRRGIEKLKSWNKGLASAGEKMWVIDLPMLPALGSSVMRAINRRMVTRRLSRVLGHLGMESPVVITTLPYITGLIRALPRRGLVYYCTDDFSHWPGADRDSLQHAEQETLSQADMVLAVSDVLTARFQSGSNGGRCRYFPHGVDLEHFASISTVQPAAEVGKLPPPRIGFFGLIYEKLDFELLAAVARRFPTGSLSLIGPVAYCPDWFRELPNVHFLGPQPYAEIPRWIAGLDVLLLPYVNDEMIRQSDPLKLRECLASGKPTVSIDIPEVRRYEPYARVGTTHDEFLCHVEQAVAEAGNVALAQSRQHAVIDDGWDRRAADLREWLSEFELATSTN